MVSWRQGRGMISWDDRDEGYDCSIRYEADLRRAERERMTVGWEPLVGWRRPVEPACPVCWYLLVNGVCAGCPETQQHSPVKRLAVLSDSKPDPNGSYDLEAA